MGVAPNELDIVHARCRELSGGACGDGLSAECRQAQGKCCFQKFDEVVGEIVACGQNPMELLVFDSSCANKVTTVYERNGRVFERVLRVPYAEFDAGTGGYGSVNWKSCFESALEETKHELGAAGGMDLRAKCRGSRVPTEETIAPIVLACQRLWS